MNVYFAGSIRGGRQLLPRYQNLVRGLKEQGHQVFTEVDQPDLAEDRDNEYIYSRDLDWILDSQCMIAEVTTPSLGVGFEIMQAITWGLSILCLAERGTSVSAMIAGCPDVHLVYYESTEDAVRIATDWLNIQANML